MEHIKKFTKLIALLSIAGMFALAAPAHALISASGESKISGLKKILKSEELLDWYKHLVRQYPIISIEDGFHEEDWTAISIQM
jgi:enolase